MTSTTEVRSYVDEFGRLVIDGQVVCPVCLEVPSFCYAARSAHDELAEWAAEAAAAPVLRVRAA